MTNVVNEKLKVACIGAGCSGTGQLILLEQFEPGCAVAFCDRNRELFDTIVDGYLGKDNSDAAGDFKTEVTGLRPSFRDLPFYTDVDEMFAKEDINTVVIATYCKSHAEMVEKCVSRESIFFLKSPLQLQKKMLKEFGRFLRTIPKLLRSTLLCAEPGFAGGKKACSEW